MAVPVAIVCVTHDAAPQLDRFACGVRRSTEGVPSRVVVVDSGSTDDTLERVAALLPEADLRTLDGNRGFSAGINAGVEHVRATGGAGAFVVLNPDVELDPGCVASLVGALDQPGVGIAAPRVRDEHGSRFPSLHRAPSVAATWCEAVLGGPLAGRLGLPTEVVWNDAAYRADADVVWATGCALALSDECLRRTGPWDESYFMYEEEVDYALRAADAGFRVRYVAGAGVTRLVGPPRPAPWAQALMHANRIALLRRRGAPVRGVALTRAGFLVGDVVRAVALRRADAWAAAWALWHGAGPAEILARYRPGARALVGVPPGP